MYLIQHHRRQFRTFFLRSRSSFNSMQFIPMHPDRRPPNMERGDGAQRIHGEFTTLSMMPETLGTIRVWCEYDASEYYAVNIG